MSLSYQSNIVRGLDVWLQVDVLFLPCLLMTYALLYSAPLYLYAQWPLTWPAPFVPCLAWVLKAAFPQW